MQIQRLVDLEDYEFGTSAITFSSSCTSISIASCPGCAYLGACMVDVA